jgi:hypothetical protein
MRHRQNPDRTLEYRTGGRVSLHLAGDAAPLVITFVQVTPSEYRFSKADLIV